jgi:vesicle-associated membrane protein 7
MPIVYALIARDGYVLVEHTHKTVETGNFQQISSQILQKISGETNTKKSYSTGGYVFNLQVNDGVTYLCLVEEGFSMRMSFLFLAEVVNRFTTTYTPQVIRSAITGQMNDFERVLAQLMEHYGSPSADKVSKAREEIENVKSIMLNNIELVLQRNEDISELSMRTEQLHDFSGTYVVRGKQIKRKMIFKNLKWTIVLVVTLVILIIIVVYIIVAQFCGWTFSDC